MMETGRSNRQIRLANGFLAAAMMTAMPLAGALAAGDKEHGKMVFAEHCAVCHGDTGGGTQTGPELFYGPGMDDTIKIVTEGKDSGKEQKMPAFGGMLSAQDIMDVSAYITQVIEGGG